ncbi:MAG: 1-deoxy-D-xylulose-5-phosphate reductoisomerase [Acidobacteriota bacterium]|nr:1-deoxy-D-xylulose-5-phosphate reductoisomerase [Acidobacteriota bacterium]
MPRRLLILGSTGSIGTQALDVVGRSEELEVVGLSAERSWELLVRQARELGVKRIALADADAAARAAEAWVGGEVLGGAEGLVRLVVESGADLVLNALVGSAGLGPTVSALGEGIDLALANKESLVVGGELVMTLAEATGARIIPVDSEHSALHQLIEAETLGGEGGEARGGEGARARAGTVRRLILTASGGPFRGRRRAELGEVGVQEALAHPTWAMGGKITIDSATLMNKGLEVIEAHHLFGLPYGEIDVVVHPQSIVHALVSLCDGATLAHMGYPDMRVPISYALHHPERAEVPVAELDLAALGSLTFERPDEEAFRCLALARQAAAAGGTAPCVLNAANEIAVHAFLGGRLPFLGIAAVIEETLERVQTGAVHSFDSLYEADREAREVAEGAVLARA